MPILTNEIWASEDGAGLRGYNVEMRESSGDWSQWLTETMQTKADFPGEDGKQYSFRMQGVDQVGNADAWLETAAVKTYAVTKYYAMAGQPSGEGRRIAMRQGSSVSFLYGDHLGSTSLVADASGATLAETRYQPYGQPYWQWGATRTDYGFTGQRLDGFGLMDYNARYYSSTLGRFISPDSIIPQPGSPLAWDRYAYTYSNPVNGVDPSGHMPVQGCGDEGKEACDPSWQEEAAYAYFVKKNEHTICQSGNMTHCSPIEKGIVNNRPITGLHVGYSGQAGYLAEGGVYVQDDFLIDWTTGTLYHVRTVGGFGYVGTPTVLSGQVNFGYTDVKGFPRYWQDEKVYNQLEGPQLDWAGALGVDAVAVLDVGTGRSYDLEPGGGFVNTNGYLMYSTSYDLIFGIDSFPNLVDGGMQGGKSESFIVTVKKLW